MNSDFLSEKLVICWVFLLFDMYGRGLCFIVDVLWDIGFMFDRCINGS